MALLCLYVAAFGIAYSLLLYVAVKRRWRMAGPLHRHAPRVATAAAAVLLLMVVMLATAETSDLSAAVCRGLKQAENTLRDWFDVLRLSR
ncbi:MAG: hypothetical protein IT427_17110 [Pirellulales bacterium]|nr:hypothetical protein [Pirellulales bacterium]